MTVLYLTHWLGLRLLYQLYLPLLAFGMIGVDRVCDLADRTDSMRARL
jgi:hypothetical protein